MQTLMRRQLYQTTEVVTLPADLTLAKPRRNAPTTQLVAPTSVFVAENLHDVYIDMGLYGLDDQSEGALREKARQRGDEVVALRELTGEQRRIWVRGGLRKHIDVTPEAPGYYMATAQFALHVVPAVTTLPLWLQAEGVGSAGFVRLLQQAIDAGAVTLTQLQGYVQPFRKEKP